MFDEVSLFLDGLIAFSPDRGADLALDLFSCKLGLNLPHDIFRKQNNRIKLSPVHGGFLLVVDCIPGSRGPWDLYSSLR